MDEASPARRGPSLAAVSWTVAGLGAAIAYLLGLGLDVMEVDAAQYAAISRDMEETGSWLELTDRGEPFLNKPPLLFWLSALSFRLFGVSDVAYRIPSALAFALGVFSTYRLAAHYAGPRAGRWSALALAGCQGAFLMNHDVRTDTLLLGLVAFSLWQAARLLDRPHASAAAWLGLGLGGALLTKGLIGLAVPALGVAGHLAMRRDGRWLRRPEPWLAVGVALLLLIPMAVGSLRQHGLEGLRFHFWTQGFGRVLDENIWGDAHGPFFFVPQLAWTFLPWTLFLALALWGRVRDLVRARGRLTAPAEGLTLAAFALAFVGLSLSRSKLPHYIYVTLPAASVLAGSWIAARLDASDGATWPRGLAMAQRLILIGVWLFVGALVVRAFPLESPLLWTALAGCAAIAASGLFARASRDPAALLAASAVTLVGANLALNAHVYPRLFEYQASASAGRHVAADPAEPKALVVFRDRDHAFDFYARETAVRSRELDGLRAALERPGDGPVWGLASPAAWAGVQAADLGAERVAEYADYPISKLTADFLDPGRRAATTTRRVLFRIDTFEP